MSVNGTRALVVEDDRVWQEILAENLGDAGLHSVDLVDNLDEALSALNSRSYHVVVADLALSGADHNNREGLQVLDAARRLDPPAVTVLLTGYATVEIAVSVLTEHGALTCLRKETFNRRQFLELVRKATASLQDAALPAKDQSRGSSSGTQRETSGTEGSEAFDSLTPREREVLDLVARGLTNKEIAQTLIITPNTVKRHLKAIFGKLGIHTRSAAAAQALRSGRL